MSRILRRPMFRGGPVNSYNTGITSGLGEPGYADGGRVGFENGDLVTRPGIGSRIASSARYYNPFTEAGIGNIGRKIFTGTPGMISRGGATIAGLYPIASTLAVPAAAIGSLAYLNRPMNEAELEFMRQNEEITSKETTDPNLYEGYFKGRAEAREKGEKAGQPKLGFFETFTKKPTETKPVEKTELEKLKEYYENLMSEKELEYQSKLGKNEKSVLTDETDIEDLLDEKKIKREADLYAKLLGGEEAKSQALYDALLAASPAFFKGKNLREAAPQVLESINKSGAFDKPRDIKQAAAQLAIQRRIAVETARAKSDDQLTRLEKQLAAKDTVLNKLSRIPGFSKDQFAGNLLKEPTPDQYPSIPPDKYFSIDGKIYVSIGENTKDPKTGKIIKITTKFSPLG